MVDSLPELGGQVSALYPEKLILDVAGFPTVKGRELVEELVEQAASAQPTYLLDRTATAPDVTDDDGRHDGARRRHRGRRQGRDHHRRHRQVQRRGRCPPGTAGRAAGWCSSCRRFAEYAGKDVVIVGGGDSAFDWAHSLEPIATSVTLVHRRDEFRAHQATVDAVLAGRTEVITKAQVTALVGEHHVESVEITTNDGEVLTRPGAGAWSRRSASSPTSSAMQEWGLEFDKRHIMVDTAMRTNLPRVFAAGDITEYDGKVRLIAVGFGEVATAVNNAAVADRPRRPRVPRPLQRRVLSAMASGAQRRHA